MGSIIKRNIARLYSLIKRNEFFRNVFKTNQDKAVLIVYLTSAFSHKEKYTHSNLTECRIAAEIFRDLGYNVDIINYDSMRTPNIQKYQIVYGMGKSFEKLFYQKSDNQLFINYATGCNPIWSNIQTTKKVRKFYEETRKILPESSRLISHTQHLQILLSDKVIVLGNDFVKNTYILFDKERAHRYINLNAFYFKFHTIPPSQKDIITARKNFLWFGSSGALHKGLDLCIEFFKNQKELTLHICGLNTDAEKRFAEFYNSELYKTKNIKFHGFVNIQSEQFKTILSNCGYVIFPSISEGGAVSLLNVIANGYLLPLYSKSTGVSLSHIGFEFDLSNPNDMYTKIKASLELSNKEYVTRVEQVQTFVEKNFSLEQYKKTLKEILKDIVNGN